MLEEYVRCSKIENGPDILSRLTLINDQSHPPIRIYLHRIGSKNYFDNQNNSELDIMKKLFYDSFTINRDLLRDADYLLAIMWGNNKKKIIDTFKFTDIHDWPGNPIVDSYVLSDGLYIPERTSIACGDGLLVLADEERYRRTTPNLDHYMRMPPEISGLEIDW